MGKTSRPSPCLTPSRLRPSKKEEGERQRGSGGSGGALRNPPPGSLRVLGQANATARHCPAAGSSSGGEAQAPACPRVAGKLQEISFYTQIPSSQPNPNVSGVRQGQERDSPGGQIPMGLFHRDRAAICGRGAARRHAPTVSMGSAFSLTSVFHQQVFECIKRRESGRVLRCGKQCSALTVRELIGFSLC